LLLDFTPGHRQVQEELPLPRQSGRSHNAWIVVGVSSQQMTNEDVEDIHHVLDSFYLPLSGLLYSRQTSSSELLLVLYSIVLMFSSFVLQCFLVWAVKPYLVKPQLKRAHFHFMCAPFCIAGPSLSPEHCARSCAWLHIFEAIPVPTSQSQKYVLCLFIVLFDKSA
jgi:hypothetical protein